MSRKETIKEKVERERAKALKDLNALEETYPDPTLSNYEEKVKERKTERRRLLNLLKDGRDNILIAREEQQKRRDRDKQQRAAQKTEDNIKYKQKTF